MLLNVYNETYSMKLNITMLLNVYNETYSKEAKHHYVTQCLQRNIQQRS